jgi:hypothetical protein
MKIILPVFLLIVHDRNTEIDVTWLHISPLYPELWSTSLTCTDLPAIVAVTCDILTESRYKQNMTFWIIFFYARCEVSMTTRIIIPYRVRFPPGAWMSVSCEHCVLSGRGLCDGLITRPEESYRLWCVSNVCDGPYKAVEPYKKKRI